jgi:hypothetical protein
MIMATWKTTADVLMTNLQIDQAGPIDVSNLLDASPTVGALFARSRQGQQFRWTQKTGAPTVGFRAANVGIQQSNAVRRSILCQSSYLDCSTKVDTSVADSDELGATHTISMDIEDHLTAGFFHAEQQIYQGTGSDAGGFPGFAQTVDDTTHPMCLSAGGSGGNLSSVWFIRTGDEKHVGLIWGGNGEIKFGQTIVQAIYDGEGGYYNAYCTSVEAWVGLQIPSLYDLGRLANVDDNVYSLTDKMINKCVQDLFPAGRKPNLVAMSRRSLGQLQNSRTPVMFTAGGQYDVVGPVPTTVCGGIPIIVTDAITNTESTLAVTA